MLKRFDPVTSPPRPAERPAESSSRLRLVPMGAIVFFGFLAIAIPLPVLPLEIHGTLGFDTLTVGWIIGLQSIVTVVSRPYGGTVVDRLGSRWAVLAGLPIATLAGATYFIATALSNEGAALAALAVGLVLLGIGESLFLTATMTWGIARIGMARTGLVMAWQGIAMYGALSAGGMLGVWLIETGGFLAVAAAATLSPLVALAVAFATPGAATVHPSAQAGPRPPLWRVLGLIWRPGMVLALAAAPFAALAAFIVLAFADRGWAGAGFAVAAFGGGYILVRLFFAHLPDRLGGVRVAAVSIAIAAAGQLLMWMAGTPTVALAGAALTGIGFSLVFPSMGVEAIRRVPAGSRGVAVGGFMAFFDVSLGITGPLAGLIVAGFGYGSLWLAGAFACLAALGLLATLRARV